MLRSPSRSSFPSSAPSPPGSPSRSPSKKKSHIGMAGVANLFIRMRRLEESTVGKQDHTVISSGEPRTQPGVKEGCNTRDQVSVEWIDNFTCVGGVNVATLLRASRTALLERVFTLGANALLNEQWECTISGPKPVHNGAYKVQVRYLADATHSTAADPHKPVALDQAKGVPGLMTITKRGGY